MPPDLLAPDLLAPAPMLDAEVAIVGGGPAGAALAIRLASVGVDVAMFERQSIPRWRACGVYSSPRTRGALRVLGLTDATLMGLIQPIDTMEVVSLGGVTVRLSHADPYACGVDRVRLERSLLDRARAVGARVMEGAAVRDLVPSTHGAAFTVTGPIAAGRWRAAVIVGADGPSSAVARAFGVARPMRRRRHAGITFHRSDPHGVERGLPATARLYLGQGWYCGVAPVPEARVNVGIVLREGALRRHLSLGVGVAGIADDLLDRLPRSLAGDVRDAPTTDAVCVALPLAHRVTRPAGDGFLLIGDAAGFLDPLSGEGIYRALVSAEIAADSITRSRLGDKDAFDGYADRMRGRFAAKDLVSQMLQLFLARPELAEFALRRMASRDAVADTFGQVLVDQLPASRVLGPRFLAGLLRP